MAEDIGYVSLLKDSVELRTVSVLPQGQRLLHLLTVLLSLGTLQQSVLSSSQLRKKGHSQYPGRGTGKTAEWDKSGPKR